MNCFESIAQRIALPESCGTVPTTQTLMIVGGS